LFKLEWEEISSFSKTSDYHNMLDTLFVSQSKRAMFTFSTFDRRGNINIRY